ncbi:hypothetical protein [Paraburkholderia dinghuensis]|uniref:Glycine zipper domain-containing protein n=1 Tax=Paraburkholderia dinghuensis TaxID=2305225 RepID=A0A3N6Q7I7_9BURK|nr:hypothetical protein [Paraburkholderia dinghuensis]RQH08486.1 hypothetical protein D1Y85_05640 [Paraburkholderia dinghuensis]
MSLIVAGRFTTFPAAEAVAEKLYERGFVEEDVNIVFVNPRGQHAHAHHAMPIAAPREPALTWQHLSHNVVADAVAGAVVGIAIFAGMSASLPMVVIAAGVGACLGAWIGMMVSRQQAAEHHERVLRETRNSGVLLSVHVTPESQAVAADVLRESHAADIERASGRWQGGHWADFDPTRSPEPYDAARQPQS